MHALSYLLILKTFFDERQQVRQDLCLFAISLFYSKLRLQRILHYFIAMVLPDYYDNIQF